MHSTELTVDWLVVGSGAAGFSSAIRACDLGMNVLMIEKSDQFGGNTAMSGGVCWVPNNPDMKRVKIPDSDARALSYLQHITQGEISSDRLNHYIHESQRMLSYFTEHANMEYRALAKYADYYAEAPGGAPGGRSMDPVPFDGSLLGDDLMRLRRPHPQSQIMGKFGITAAQAHSAIGVGIRTLVFMAWQMAMYGLRYFKRRRLGRDTRLCAGNSLVGRLLKAARDRNIDLRLDTSLVDLIVEGEAVVGAVIESRGVQTRVHARRGVFLGSGGFSRNPEMRAQYLPAPTSPEWTAGAPSNTGDGIRAGMRVGGGVALMDEAWWTPVSVVPKSPHAWVLVVEKSLPHGLFVNQLGERFTNEAAPYIDVVHGMQRDATRNAALPNAPRWFHVFDATYRRSSIAGPIPPGKVMPDASVPKRLRDGRYLHKAASLDALAAQIGVPPETLQRTITRFNKHAILGVDPDFQRGETAQDRYYGDPRVKPNCALGPIESSPFYAVEIFPGDLGTKGGLTTDLNARVLNEQGDVITGLYAAGNATASVMGRTYPGAGGTISPALTFGMLAAEAALGDQTTSSEHPYRVNVNRSASGSNAAVDRTREHRDNVA